MGLARRRPIHQQIGANRSTVATVGCARQIAFALTRGQPQHFHAPGHLVLAALDRFLLQRPRYPWTAIAAAMLLVDLVDIIVELSRLRGLALCPKPVVVPAAAHHKSPAQFADAMLRF